MIQYNKNTSTVAFHISEPATIMVKSPNCRTWKLATTTASTINVKKANPRSSESKSQPIQVSIKINPKSESESFESVLKQDQALQRELRTSYSSPPAKTECNPEKWFPIMKDPKLVRAGQLASLALLEEATVQNNDLMWIISRFYGLELRFNELLRSESGSESK